MMLAKLTKILLYLAFVLSPIVPALIWLGIFVVFNFVTEIWQQVKLKKLNAKGVGAMLTHLIKSIIIYFIFIIVSRGFDLIVPATNQLPFTAVQIAISICAIREFKPIIENVGTIMGIDIWAYFKEKINFDNVKK